MNNVDVLLNTEYDLDFFNDDFKIDDSSYQDINLLLAHEAGDFKQYPTIGVGMIKMMNGLWTIEQKTKISTELSNDGYQLNNVLDNVQKILTELELDVKG